MRPTTTSDRGRSSFLLVVLLLAFATLLCRTGNASAQQLAGVHAHLLWPEVDGPARREELRRLKDAGADIVRVDVGWSTLEPRAKGEYELWYLERLDQLVTEAHESGLELLLDVVDAPCWASSAPPTLKDDCRGAWWDRGVQRYAPTRASDYADALEFLIRRFGGRVRAWEIGNEPNLSYYFRADDPAEAYATLLKTAYARAKEVDLSTFVVGGALSTSDVGFVRALLRHGIAGRMDAFSFHPYSENSSPLEPFPDQWIASSFIRGVPQVRQELVTAGVSVPLWLTELGWSTCARRDAIDWWDNCVDESAQARYIEQAYTQMLQWSYVGAGFVYKAVDDGPRGSPTGSDRETHFGIFAFDGRAKPAVEAFRRSAARLHTVSAPPPVVTPPPGPTPAPTPTDDPPGTVSTTTTPPPLGPSVPDPTSNSATPTPVIIDLSVSGKAVVCRKRCLRGPAVVELEMARRARVTVRAQVLECVRTCRWHASTSKEFQTASGTRRWSITDLLPVERLRPGRWRLESTARESGHVTRRLATFDEVLTAHRPSR